MTTDEAPKTLSIGKYRGVAIEDVPTDYIEWAVDNWEPGSWNYEIVENELIRRKSGKH